jgi:hypothetical protein
MLVGYDKNGQILDLGDICNFKIDNVNYEGMITYDEMEFAYTFEMEDDSFPSVFMKKADLGSIEKITNVWLTQPDKDNFDFYREIAKNA